MYRIHISEKNHKLGRIPNLNLPPCKDCGDKPCKDKCYAVRAYRQYPLVRLAWDDNDEYYKNNPDGFVNEFINKMKKSKKTLFRWHASGELLGQTHLNNLIYIANELPNIKFLIFTKRYDLNYSHRPKNLIIVFSAWPGMPLPEKCFEFPIAWMKDKKGIEKRMESRKTYVCPGISKKTTCSKCKLCWNIEKMGKDVIFPEH